MLKKSCRKIFKFPVLVQSSFLCTIHEYIIEAMVVVERKGNKDHLPGKESQRKKVHMVSLVRNWCCCQLLLLMKFHACKFATSLFRKVHFRCPHESREVRFKNFYSRELCFLHESFRRKKRLRFQLMGKITFFSIIKAIDRPHSSIQQFR